MVYDVTLNIDITLSRFLKKYRLGVIIQIFS